MYRKLQALVFWADSKDWGGFVSDVFKIKLGVLGAYIY